jgi:hypothetical protein
MTWCGPLIAGKITPFQLAAIELKVFGNAVNRLGDLVVAVHAVGDGQG